MHDWKMLRTEKWWGVSYKCWCEQCGKMVYIGRVYGNDEVPTHAQLTDLVGDECAEQ